MSRSPLAYPLNRTADTEVGGAADLQTDIMRFMAILSLCLVAIFALVQSIPLTPVEPLPEEPVAVGGPSGPKEVAFAAEAAPTPAASPAPAEPQPVDKPVVLTRPKWIPKYTPTTSTETTPEPVAEPVAEAVAEAPPEAPPPAEPEKEGFTLRFASDAALTRAVAAHHVGLYAIETGRAKRMTVSESRISFWDASVPNSFHEMETSTVPVGVIRALARTGVATDAVSWGVTLPGRMKSQLDTLMHEHRSGSLIISAGGDIHWEAS